MEKRLTEKNTFNSIHNEMEKIRERIAFAPDSMNPSIEEMAYIETYEMDKLRYEKLGQLEDIEEELGINLLVLLQALKDGISYTTKSGKKDYYLGWELYLDYDNQCFRNIHEGRQYDPSCDAYDGTGWYEFDDTFDFCDFGKSWEILTKEMYENIRKGKC